MKTLFFYPDREIVKKCGLDAYFFLRYLKALLVIFIPICCVVMPILVPMNYVDGIGREINVSDDDDLRNDSNTVTGLDTLAWGNVKNTNTRRYNAHLLMAILVVIWVCTVFFFELRVYVKVRQDYLTSAEHRLRASATTVLVNSIPGKWLSEEALRGLFDVFPGGVRNIWLNRDLTVLLDKISLRDSIHKQLEAAETDLIKMAKKAQLKQRKKDEKAQRKIQSKEEKAARQVEEDELALRMANSPGGQHVGESYSPYSLTDGARDHQLNQYLQGQQQDKEKHNRTGSKGRKSPAFGEPFSKLGLGLKGAASKAGNGVGDTLETTNGFVGLTDGGISTGPKNRRLYLPGEDEPRQSSDSLTAPRSHSRSPSNTSEKPSSSYNVQGPAGNTVRKLDNVDDLYSKERVKIWQFWKPPAGGYTSPVPQGEEAADYMAKEINEPRSFFQKFAGTLPFASGEEPKPLEYGLAYNPDHADHDAGEPVWAKYLKKKDRPTHHLPLFGVQMLPGLPFVTKKVDTIHWCREELARLNLEIEEDQKHPERYPLMTSAFIQFEHQVAAHMACQSVMHHIPQHMAPRILEISPRDVVWDNMATAWWQEWLRTGLVWAVVLAMVFLWAIPVAFTASLSQLNELIQDAPWLSFLTENETIETLAKAVAGVLPTVLLAVLLILVPIVLEFLASFKGAKTGSQKIEFVQQWYFVFLFIQVFLIVSIASFFAASLDKLVDNVSQLRSVDAVLRLLANNLPKAANYFFSYMVLQALSTSSGTLLQIGTLAAWFIIGRMMDTTARQKWQRNTSLSNVQWGKFFPVYTNFACIGIIYSVIAPLISIFAVITFSLLWLAHRYSMLYVTRFESDTGGVLYPRAINQTFTGLYFMELCMAGLFIIVKDEKGELVCTQHGIIMGVVAGLTVIYQVLLNRSFSPLFRYLPITTEDEAVLRDDAFQRAQEQRFGIDEADEYEDADEGNSREKRSDEQINGDDIEMSSLKRKGTGGLKLKNPVKQVGAWAKTGGEQVRKITLTDEKAVEYRRKQRQKDLEAQQAIGDALYGGMNDDIEDLTPQERDMLTRHAFKHEALRARRPTVWIPRDDLGISDDEIRRTQLYSEEIWISNESTALDSKVRVVYGKNPPDFSEVDVINL